MNIIEELSKGGNIYNLPLRVTYYARVSTDNDTQISSITNQVDYFKNMIISCENWTLISGYVDEGISGKDTKRREDFLRMIKDGIDRRFDLILTKSVSRFARNTIDSIRYTDILKNNGVGVFFINDNINTFCSDSEFRLTLMASIAQDEIRKLSESVKFGLRQSIERGVVLGNDNILGYRKDNGKLVVIDAEAMIVKDIFEMFVTDKYSYREAARVINSKYGKRLDSTSVKRVLTNYKYKGYYCGRKSVVIDYKNNKRKKIDFDDWVLYKDYDRVPPIVDEDLWDRVNDIINVRKNKREVNKSWYSNKIWCLNHNRMYRHVVKKYKSKIYSYFRCNGCSNINEDLIDRMCIGRGVDSIYITKEKDFLIVKVKYFKVLG